MANLPVSGEWTAAPEIPVQRTVVALPTKLNVVLPFIESDVPQVINLLKWCAELSGRINYSIFLLPFKGLNFTEIKMYAERAFTDVQVIPDSEGIVSDWKSDEKIKDAAGPNSMFRQAAWYFYFHKELGPWLYLEPDCVPLTDDWLKRLEDDHASHSMPISGVKMEWADEPYLNGVAIYPQNLVAQAAEIVTRVMWEQHPDKEVAFDVAGRSHVLKKAHLTNKIQLSYRTEGVPILIPGAVLYHGDRNGQIIERLQKKEGDVPSMRETTAQTNGAADVPPVASAENTPDPTQTVEAYLESNPTPTIGDEIRYHCDELLRIVTENESRKKRVVDELRKRKLIPKTAKTWNRRHQP